MSNITLADLDFDLIKRNLKNFLRDYRDKNGAPIFTDFDFEGSNWSILLDALSYNTHINAYLANMIINEMFIDSAVKRSSVVSLSKHLGYTPVSTRSARATITFTVSSPTNSPQFLTLERYTPFNTTINGVVYTFINLEPVTIQPVNGVYTFNNVEIVEGLPLEYVFRVNVPGPGEKYEIPNDTVDTTTLVVNVQKSFADTSITSYSLAENFSGITGLSKVYFIEENPLERFQIYFGDGIIGNKLVPGNLIRVQYVVSSGDEANVADSIDQIFECATTVGGGVVDLVSTIINSHGGSSKEDIESIRFNATKFNTANDRAVTAEDYKAIIQAYYPLAESVACWGGEETNPPEYGTVYISLKPYEGFAISEAKKEEILNNIVNVKKLLTVIPKIVDPEYYYVNLTVNVKYDNKSLSVSSSDLQNSVTNAIRNYFSQDLQKFDKDFVFSKLSRNIDNVNDAIIGNLMTVKLQKRISPSLNISTNFNNTNSIKFNNKVEPGTLSTTRFFVSSAATIVSARIYDLPNTNPPDLNGTGTLVLKNADNGLVIVSNLGSVNYATGELSITGLNVYGYPLDTNDIRIMFTVQDSALDIQVSKNQILVLDDSTLNALSNRLDGLTVNTIATTI